MRSDGRRNRAAILTAAGELVRESGTVRMDAIAEQAGLSVATAYRHFPTVESVFEAYMLDVGLELRSYSLSLQPGASLMLPMVARKWVDLCLVHGPATVHMRSRRGYLERLREGADYLMAIRDALLRPLIQTAEAHGFVVAIDDEERVLFLYNILFDPREILDLHHQRGLSAAQCTEQLLAALTGAMSQWLPARTASDDSPDAVR